MSIWLDLKYINIISIRLERFKEKNKELFNFRCPICGDSQKNKNKARGWIFNKKGNFLFFCHNCSASMSFSNFLKNLDVILHQDYNKEKFIENNFNNPLPIFKPDITKNIIPKYRIDSPLSSLTKISSLPWDHPVKKYILNRKIPSNRHYKIFLCNKFKTWVNSFLPDKFKDFDKDECRLILPFLDKENNFFGCQARNFSSLGSRYITILLDDESPKLFGLDTVNFSKPVYIFEGPIDSLFIDNSIAMCGSDLSKAFINDKKKCTIIFDNESRSIQIVKKIGKYIDLGYNVCLWPKQVKGKDLNEMILNGHESEELKILIDKNTFFGIEAKLNLQMWRDC